MQKKIPIACTRGKTMIYTDLHDSLIQKLATWCVEYLTRRGFSVCFSDTYQPEHSLDACWIFELENHCPVSESLGIDVHLLQDVRADGFMLHISDYCGQSIVAIISKNSQGIRAGIARLITSSTLQRTSMDTDMRSEVRSPFFRTRRLHVGQTGRIAQIDPWTDTLWTNWKDDRIKAYVEQLWLYGYNSLEIGELRGYANPIPLNEWELAKKVTPKMIVLARAAHEWGMEVCQFIWGQSLFEEGQNFCWHNPAERAMMRTEYARLARLYGKSVDHIVVHVGDPGGCVRNGCDPFKTTQEIATAIWAEYKKVNPQCTATLSTWANFGFWDNRNDSAFLDQTYSSMDMAIALHRWYDEDKVSLLRSTGREIDIWGWYLSDYEMSCNSHLLMQRLDRYYSTLPVEASATIRTLSTEICYSGLPSQINVYISAQKMWDPYRSLEDIEIEFCRGTFGPNQAIPILTIYKVCEEYVHPENYYYFIPATDCLPVVFGTTEYNTRLECAMALTTKVIFDDSEPLGLTSATPPSILYHYLNRQLHLISIFSQTKAVIKALSLSCGDPDQRDDLICKAINQAEPYKETLDYQHLIHDVEA